MLFSFSIFFYILFDAAGARDDYYVFSFFPKTINDWYLIPTTIRTVSYSKFCDYRSYNSKFILHYFFSTSLFNYY